MTLSIVTVLHDVIFRQIRKKRKSGKSVELSELESRAGLFIRTFGRCVTQLIAAPNMIYFLSDVTRRYFEPVVVSYRADSCGCGWNNNAPNAQRDTFIRTRSRHLLWKEQSSGENKSIILFLFIVERGHRRSFASRKIVHHSTRF